MQTHPQAGAQTLAVPTPRVEKTYRLSGGVPGDPALTRRIIEEIESLKVRYAIPRSAALAALGIDMASWHAWKHGRHSVRPRRAQRVLERILMIVKVIDPGTVRELPPGAERRERFLAAVTHALAMHGQT